MTGLRLTEQAEVDLDELWAYIAANSQDAADRMVDAILASARLHVRFPSMGQKRPELGPGLRSFVVSPYVAFYRAAGEELVIIRIIHGARDVRSLDVSITEIRAKESSTTSHLKRMTTEQN